MDTLGTQEPAGTFPTLIAFHVRLINRRVSSTLAYFRPSIRYARHGLPAAALPLFLVELVVSFKLISRRNARPVPTHK